MIQIKSWFKAHKNEIVTSVIVSIVTAIIIKFGEIFLFLAPKADNSIWRVFRDSIYYQAGRFSVTTCITFLISCLSAIVFGLILSLVMSTVKALNQYELLNRIEQIIERKEADPSIELSTDENKLIDKYREANTSNIPSAKKIKKNLISLVLVGILLIIWIWTSIILPASLHQGFERCIAQIAPYVEEDDVLRLRSQWVSMQGKNDYDAIDEYIFEIRKQHNLN